MDAWLGARTSFGFAARYVDRVKRVANTRGIAIFHQPAILYDDLYEPVCRLEERATIVPALLLDFINSVVLPEERGPTRRQRARSQTRRYLRPTVSDSRNARHSTG